MNYQSVLLDIDVDFMIGDKHIKPPEKAIISGKELGKKLRWFRKRNTRIYLVVDHHEALFCWDRENIENALCFHIDAHHDVWELRSRPVVGLRGEDIDCGNYLQQALFDGIVQKVIFVPAKDCVLVDEREDIIWRLNKKIRPSRVRVVSWNTFQKMKRSLPKADVITIAISPEWTPEILWPEIESLCTELGVNLSDIRVKKRVADKKWLYWHLLDSHSFKFPYNRRP